MSDQPPRKWRQVPIEIPDSVRDAAIEAMETLDDGRTNLNHASWSVLADAALQAAMQEWKGDRPAWADQSNDKARVWYEERWKEQQTALYEAREMAQALAEKLNG